MKQPECIFEMRVIFGLRLNKLPPLLCVRATILRHEIAPLFSGKHRKPDFAIGRSFGLVRQTACTLSELEYLGY